MPSWSPEAHFPGLCPVPGTVEEPQPACHKHSISAGWMKKLMVVGEALLLLKVKNKLGFLPFTSKRGDKNPRRSSLLVVFLIKIQRLRPVLFKWIKELRVHFSSEASKVDLIFRIMNNHPLRNEVFYARHTEKQIIFSNPDLSNSISEFHRTVISKLISQFPVFCKTQHKLMQETTISLNFYKNEC